MGQLFGTDGIRGRANQYPITPEIALRLGKAISCVFRPRRGTQRVVIGKDTRLSGYMLETALASGLVSAGMDVLMVGPVPTPAVAHLTKSMACSAGIMLTASHNPFTDNGIKIFDRNGYKLDDESEKRIEDLVLSEEPIPVSEMIGKAQRIEDARGRYVEFAKSTVANQNLEGLKIVLDCANGAAYLIGPWIFRELGAEVTKTHVAPDGCNINLECGALHPRTVGRTVWVEGADVGIAFDGDADRVMFTDSRGQVVDGDRILAICAIEFKRRGILANDTLVVTSMSNLGLHEAVRRHGIHVEVTDVGDRHVIERMRKGGFNLGGEKSGHVIFGAHGTTGDGIITALQVLRIMQVSGKPLHELAACVTEYPQKLTSVRVREKPQIETVRALHDAVSECREALGDAGRVVVRYSGTEPKIRVLVEAAEAEVVTNWSTRLTDIARKELGA